MFNQNIKTTRKGILKVEKTFKFGTWNVKNAKDGNGHVNMSKKGP